MKKWLFSGLVLASALVSLGATSFAQNQTAVFTAQDFKERRDKLIALIPDAVAILEGRECYYFTGLESPEMRLILVPQAVANASPNPQAWRTTIYLPPKSPGSGVWDDPKPSYGDDTAKSCGIENSAPLSSFLADVAKLGNITGTVFVSFHQQLLSPTEVPSGLDFVESVRKVLPGVRMKNLAPLIDQLRWKKSPKEIEAMKRACGITVQAFEEAARKAKPGMFEYELEAIVNYNFRKNGGRPAFMIIGSGPNSCVLHHMTNDRQMLKDELIVVDIGITLNSMSTDLTRTIPVSGTFTPEQRKVYSVVLEAQKKAISMVKPGVTLAELNKAALEITEKAGYGKYFLHGISHTLNGGNTYNMLTYGLYNPVQYDVRLFGGDNPVVPGSMFTIEPGIYIPEKNLGVRIEDSILVTETGCEVLTAAAPKEMADIEKLVGRAKD